MPCPSGSIGVALYLCMGPEGYWDPQGPDLSNCTSPWVNIISQKIKAGETAAAIARELAEQTKSGLQAGDVTSTVRAMVQLVDLLDVQLRNLTPGGKDSAARSLNKVLRSGGGEKKSDDDDGDDEVDDNGGFVRRSDARPGGVVSVAPAARFCVLLTGDLTTQMASPGKAAIGAVTRWMFRPIVAKEHGAVFRLFPRKKSSEA
ncbi:hypothetical protein CRUP_038707 [Coryphaenoides rupestris]|nr:hypothetical protein CRUP_038707 [Coryphaenoides rupestris]